MKFDAPLDFGKPDERRRPAHLHELTVRLAGGAQSIEVVCRCGIVVGGKRYEDRRAVTMTDLLELVRLHHASHGGVR